MAFDSPGRADPLSAALLQAWNKTIATEYERQRPQWGSRFFALDPATLTSPTPATVKWFGDPAEPVFCRSLEVAQRLADWAPKGRRVLHNEYCEYAVVYGSDGGRPRPKRVEVTTELREYWVCVARATTRPSCGRWHGGSSAARRATRSSTASTIRSRCQPQQREARFVAHLAPANGEAVGRLNTDRALFMNHPINGLDDLIYIVMFGAQPYAVRQGNTVRAGNAGRDLQEPERRPSRVPPRRPGRRPRCPRRRLRRAECRVRGPARHVHPELLVEPVLLPGSAGSRTVGCGGGGAGAGCTSASCSARTTTTTPSSTTSGCRPAPPTSRSPAASRSSSRSKSGHCVVVGAPTTVGANEYRIVPRSTAAIRCAQAEVCGDIRRLESEYAAAHAPGPVRVGPRVMGPNP